MAINFPGPYQLRVYYDCVPAAEPSLTHVMQFNLDCDSTPDPGDPFSDIDVLRRSGDPSALSDVVGALMTVLRPICSLADTAFNYAELWAYEAGTENASYVSSLDISLAGSDDVDGVPAELEVYSFRTIEGGIMKIYLLEQLHPGRVPENYTDLSDEEKDFVDWVVAPTSAFFLGRDTSYPFVFHKLSASESEHTFERRYRI